MILDAKAEPSAAACGDSFPFAIGPVLQYIKEGIYPGEAGKWAVGDR